MSNRCGYKNSKPKLSTTKQAIRNAFFVAFSIWLLYYIRDSYIKIGLSGESVAFHINTLGRKALVKPLKSTHELDSTLTMNPDEMNDDGFGVKEPKKEDNMSETGFSGVNKLESVSAEGLTKMKSNKPDYVFLDENGIPEIDRGRFVGNGSTQPGNETRV